MEQETKKLPSFKGLTVIAAVVRHQNFTAASHELHVTPSAVSKQVALVESWLGVSLFDRRGGAVLPLPNAHRIADAVDAANGLLLDAVASIRPRAIEGPLRVATPTTFAMRWLIPRLWSFSARHPAVSVDVIQTHARDDLASVTYDVAIRQGPPFPLDTRPQQIFNEALGLVMSPALLRSRRAETADLSRVTLLESDSRPGELDRWLAAGPVKVSRQRRRFPHFYIALEAALSGEGALVAPMVTLAGLIERGLLCEPFGSRRLPAAAVVAFGAPGGQPGAGTDAFLKWLGELAVAPK